MNVLFGLFKYVIGEINDINYNRYSTLVEIECSGEYLSFYTKNRVDLSVGQNVRIKYFSLLGKKFDSGLVHKNALEIEVLNGEAKSL